MNITRLGAIDIGSNAIRLMISSVDNSSNIPAFRKLAFLRVPIRLGEDTFQKGYIDEEKKRLLAHALEGFASIMKAYKVENFLACATSAMREAKNGKEIVKEIFDKTNIKLNIIPGSVEAAVIYEAGGLYSVVNPNKNYLYVDVGGGSTEVVLYSNHKVVESDSFQVGTVRFLQKSVKKEELERFKTWLRKIYKKNSPLGIIGSGGNINKIHKILCKNAREPISYTEMTILYDTLKAMTYEERQINMNLNTYRADVIIPAMEIFLMVGSLCKVNEYFVPKVGVVDGIIHLLNSEKNQSKLAKELVMEIHKNSIII